MKRSQVSRAFGLQACFKQARNSWRELNEIGRCRSQLSSPCRSLRRAIAALSHLVAAGCSAGPTHRQSHRMADRAPDSSPPAERPKGAAEISPCSGGGSHGFRGRQGGASTAKEDTKRSEAMRLLLGVGLPHDRCLPTCMLVHKVVAVHTVQRWLPELFSLDARRVLKALESCDPASRQEGPEVCVCGPAVRVGPHQSLTSRPERPSRLKELPAAAPGGRCRGIGGDGSNQLGALPTCRHGPRLLKRGLQSRTSSKVCGCTVHRVGPGPRRQLALLQTPTALAPPQRSAARCVLPWRCHWQRPRPGRRSRPLSTSGRPTSCFRWVTAFVRKGCAGEPGKQGARACCLASVGSSLSWLGSSLSAGTDG